MADHVKKINVPAKYNQAGTFLNDTVNAIVDQLRELQRLENATVKNSTITINRESSLRDIARRIIDPNAT